MGLQLPDRWFKSDWHLSKSDVVAYGNDVGLFLLIETIRDIKLEYMKRYEFIDTLRGLAIISMIAFHTCWTLNHFSILITNEALTSTAFMVWERSICMTFILVSGFSFSLGRKPLRNGLIIFGFGLLIMLVTCLFIPGIRILFGIMTFLGSAMLLMIPVDRIIGKTVTGSKPAAVTLFVLSAAVFIFIYHINAGYVGWPPFDLALPKWMYSGMISTYFGFMMPGFWSDDYFAILPWLFLYICGYALHKALKGTAAEELLVAWKIPFINTLGKHSLVIYLAHQVIIYPVVMIINFAFF